MSVEYKNGSFGKTFPFEEAMEKFQDALNAGTAKALHVGTPEELEKVKAARLLDDKIKTMEARIFELELRGKSALKFPSAQEVKKFSRRDSQ